MVILTSMVFPADDEEEFTAKDLSEISETKSELEEGLVVPFEKVRKSSAAESPVNTKGRLPITVDGLQTLVIIGFSRFWRRHPDLNWGMEDLQSSALATWL